MKKTMLYWALAFLGVGITFTVVYLVLKPTLPEIPENTETIVIKAAPGLLDPVQDTETVVEEENFSSTFESLQAYLELYDLDFQQLEEADWNTLVFRKGSLDPNNLQPEQWMFLLNTNETETLYNIISSHEEWAEATIEGNTNTNVYMGNISTELSIESVATGEEGTYRIIIMKNIQFEEEPEDTNNVTENSDN